MVMLWLEFRRCDVRYINSSGASGESSVGRSFGMDALKLLKRLELSFLFLGLSCRYRRLTGIERSALRSRES